MHFPSQLAKAKQCIATYPDKREIYNKHNPTTFYMVKINIQLNYLLPHKGKKKSKGKKDNYRKKIITEKQKLELITQISSLETTSEGLLGKMIFLPQ